MYDIVKFKYKSNGINTNRFSFNKLLSLSLQGKNMFSYGIKKINFLKK